MDAENSPVTAPKRQGIAHLKAYSFKPGQSGNPGGRPKGSGTLTAVLAQYMGGKEGQRYRAQIVVETLFKLARKGDIHAIKYICDRLEGTPRQTLTHEGSEDRPVHVRSSDRPSAANR